MNFTDFYEYYSHIIFLLDILATRRPRVNFTTVYFITVLFNIRLGLVKKFLQF